MNYSILQMSATILSAVHMLCSVDKILLQRFGFTFFSVLFGYWLLFGLFILMWFVFIVIFNYTRIS